MIKLRAWASVCVCVWGSVCGSTTTPCRAKATQSVDNPCPSTRPTHTHTIRQSRAISCVPSDRAKSRVVEGWGYQGIPTSNSHTYSIFYLMHSLLILIFISVSIFFFTLLGCVFLCHPRQPCLMDDGDGDGDGAGLRRTAG